MAGRDLLMLFGATMPLPIAPIPKNMFSPPPGGSMPDRQEDPWAVADFLMLFGATMPIPTAPLPKGTSPHVPCSTAASMHDRRDSEIVGSEVESRFRSDHIYDATHCAICHEEFVFFLFGVRNRRWCCSCRRPLCQKCIGGSGALSVTVLCKECSANGPKGAPLDRACPNPSSQSGNCELCQASFSFFRGQRQCVNCRVQLCEVCSVAPAVRGGANQREYLCPQCAYGVDCRARPSGVNPQAKSCKVCGVSFHFFRRRHWCRACGATICRYCSPSDLSVTSRRHPNCICKKCHVPPVFRLSFTLAQYCMGFLDEKGRDQCLRVCTRFQRLVDLPFPMVNALEDYFTVDPENALLGSGGFAKVYRCTASQTGRPCAVKVIAKNQFFSLRQWSLALREIDIQCAIGHPHSVQLYHVLQTTQNVFLVMELVDGMDMGDFFQLRQRFRESQVASITAQLLEFLQHIHGLSVVHRDIKPENLLLTADLTHVKVADFGLAKFIEPPASSSIDGSLESPSPLNDYNLPHYMSAARLSGAWPAHSPCSPTGSPFACTPPTSGPQQQPRSLNLACTPLSSGRLSLGRTWTETAHSPLAGLCGTSLLHMEGNAPCSASTPTARVPKVHCTPCGTLRFCAPEVLAPNAHRKRYSYHRIFKRDMFSLGVVLHLLLVGKLPYRSFNVETLRKEMEHPPQFNSREWGTVTHKARDFCAQLLSLSPDHRPTAEDALKHEWFLHWGRQPKPSPETPDAVGEPARDLQSFRECDALVSPE